MKNVKKCVVLLFALACVAAMPVFAGTLTIEGLSKIEFNLEGDQLKITGSYEISNKGDEVAQNVFPLFEIGSWKWAGEGRTIDHGKAEVWLINESFAASRLGCVAGQQCTEKSKVSRGYIAVRVLRMYEDSNGHPFSAPDVLRTFIGDINGEDRAALRAPKLSQALDCKGDGQKFKCKALLKSNVTAPLEVTVVLHTTREVEVNAPIQNVTIAAGNKSELEFELSNTNGLAGSTYPALAIAEWSEGDLRNSLLASELFAIEEPQHSPFYLVAGGAAFVLVMGLLYWFVLRQRD